MPCWLACCHMGTCVVPCLCPHRENYREFLWTGAQLQSSFQPHRFLGPRSLLPDVCISHRAPETCQNQAFGCSMPPESGSECVMDPTRLCLSRRSETFPTSPGSMLPPSHPAPQRRGPSHPHCTATTETMSHRWPPHQHQGEKRFLLVRISALPPLGLVE